MMDFLKANNKTIYVGILLILAVCLLLGYVPGMMSFSSWVTPPVALFLGLAFALLCGQAYPKFNKKVSKKLLQYSVVGLGFGMNLHASLASGKEGMLFTIISVIGTMIIGMFIAIDIICPHTETMGHIQSIGHKIKVITRFTILNLCHCRHFLSVRWWTVRRQI